MTAQVLVQQVLLKRGNTQVASAYTGPVGEVVIDTDLHSLRVQDATTRGGHIIATTEAIPVLVTDFLANLEPRLTANIRSNVAGLLGNITFDGSTISSTYGLLDIVDNTMTMIGSGPTDGAGIILNWPANPSSIQFITLKPDNQGYPNYWSFDTYGNLILPVGGDILDSDGNSVLGGAADRLISGNSQVVLDEYGVLTLPNGGKISPQDVEGIDLVSPVNPNGYIALTSYDYHNWMWVDPGGAYIEASNGYRPAIWSFENTGTIRVPLRFPVSFTAVLDGDHCTTNPGLSLTGPAWEFNLQWQCNPNGEVELLADNGPLPSLVAGYADDQSFDFTEADHGIPGYTLTITLSNVAYPGGAGWTADLNFSAPPVYPPAVHSAGAIKLSSSGQAWTFGTDGNLVLPAGGDIVDSTGASVLGGGGSTGNFTFDGDIIDNGSGAILRTNRGNLALGVNMEAPGTPDHFHVAFEDSNLSPSSNELYFGDDYNYLRLISSAQGVSIGTNDRSGGGQRQWRFKTDGKLQLPAGGDIVDSSGNSVLGGGSESYFGTVDKFFTVQSTYIISTVDIGTNSFTVEGNAVGDILTHHHFNINAFYSIEYQLPLAQPPVYDSETGLTTIRIDDIDSDFVNNAWPGYKLRCIDRYYQQQQIGFSEAFTFDNEGGNVVGLKPINTLVNGSKTVTLDSAGVLSLPEVVAVGAGVIQPAGNGYSLKLISNGNTWNFDTDGTTTFPYNQVITTGEGSDMVVTSAGGLTLTKNDGNTWTWKSTVSVNDNVVISTNIQTTSRQWTFDTSGILTLPNNAEIRPNGTGIDLRAGSAGYAQIQNSNAGQIIGVNDSLAYVQTARPDQFQVGANENTNMDNVIWVDKNVYPGITSVTTSWQLLSGGTRYSIASIEDETPSPGLVRITMEDTGLVFGYGTLAEFHTPTSWNWEFDNYGNLNAPGDVRITGTFSNTTDGYLNLRGSNAGPTPRIHLRNYNDDPTSDVNVHLQTGNASQTFELFMLGASHATYPYSGGIRSNSSTAPIIIQTDTDIANNTWVFGLDGSLTVPGDIKSAAGTGDVVIEANNGSTARTWTFGGNGTLEAPGEISITTNNSHGGTGYTGFLTLTSTQNGVSNPNKFIRLNVDGNLQIIDSAYQHTIFDLADSGDLAISGNLTTTAGKAVSATHLNATYLNYETNGSLQVGQSSGGSFLVATKRFQVLSAVPTSSKGSDGDVVGCVAFDANYVYYCSAAYDGTNNIWHRVVWTDNNW